MTPDTSAPNALLSDDLTLNADSAAAKLDRLARHHTRIQRAFFRSLRELVSDHEATGPLLTDAVLAALAMEHGALLASTDQDFRRFPELRSLNPLGT